VNESELVTVFEDENFLAINKPFGMPSQDDPTKDPSVLGILSGQEKYEGITLPHRIDRPAGGVLLFAKSKKARTEVPRMLKDGRVTRIYWAVISGSLPDVEGTLRHDLKNDTKKNKTDVDGEGKRSVLHYRIVAKTDNYTLVEINLKTGRHHQIRAQLSAVGCPIKGDLKYGSKRSNPWGGIYLFSRSLSLVWKGKEFTFTAEPPADVLWDLFPREQEND